jgi:glutaredoxin
VPVVTLYGKPGCHLCDDARTVIEGVRGMRELELREIDVSLDPRMLREYGERIPVVEVDGDEAFQYHVDPLRLLELLGA